MLRTFSPYEKNQLTKYGISLDVPASNQTPVEYLTGRVEFLEYEFVVNHNVLIPRIETEELVQCALNTIESSNKNSFTICDIATGSGAIGISLSLALGSKNTPHQLYLSDISPLALEVAKENARRLLPKTRQPLFIQSSLLSNYPPLKFDLITANLPYIPSSRIPTLDPSVKDFEPILALDGGKDGADLINHLLEQLPSFLAPKSTAILEIDHTHSLSSFKLPKNFTYKILKDTLNYPRFLFLQNFV